MSRYFETLRRIERERENARREAMASGRVVELRRPAVENPAAESHAMKGKGADGDLTLSLPLSRSAAAQAWARFVGSEKSTDPVVESIPRPSLEVSVGRESDATNEPVTEAVLGSATSPPVNQAESRAQAAREEISPVLSESNELSSPISRSTSQSVELDVEGQLAEEVEPSEIALEPEAPVGLPETTMAIEADRTGDAADAVGAEQNLPAPQVPAVSRRYGFVQTPLVSGVEDVFNNLRAVAGGKALKTLVFCGAGPTQSVAALTLSLAAYAERRGLRVLRGILRDPVGKSGIVRLLSPRQAPGDRFTITEETVCAVQIDLLGGVDREPSRKWAEKIVPVADMILIQAPPLAKTIDGALLARACDGLVIVADTAVTDRSELTTAAERARAAQCRTLGIVMNASNDPMPPWLSSLIAESRQLDAK